MKISILTPNVDLIVDQVVHPQPKPISCKSIKILIFAPNEDQRQCPSEVEGTYFRGQESICHKNIKNLICTQRSSCGGRSPPLDAKGSYVLFEKKSK
jgi:hypothetical protein